jgi:hypothetical protein
MDEEEIKIVYKPPKHLRDEINENIRFLLEDTHTINLKRDLVYCADCEATSWIGKLNQLNLKDESPEDMMKCALLWILENTDWPVAGEDE